MYSIAAEPNRQKMAHVDAANGYYMRINFGGILLAAYHQADLVTYKYVSTV